MWRRLPETADQTRQKIKHKIAQEAESYQGDDKQYNTEEINFYLRNMIIEMGYETKDVDWTMWLFTTSKLIRNNARAIDVIPIYAISEKPSITSGGLLREGHSIHIAEEVLLSPKAIVVFIFPLHAKVPKT